MDRTSQREARFWARISRWLLLLIFLSGGCLSRRHDAGSRDTLRFHNWWNYYERGVRRIAAGDFRGGRTDMEVCLGLKPGARFAHAKDSRRERTYGMHVIENCFPHRELGICAYNLNDPHGAAEHLQTSLDQQPSGRAKHYLNLVRRELLRSAKTPAPVVDIAPDALTLWTRERVRDLRGTAHSEGYVSDVVINGAREFIELAVKQRPFSVPVRLREGGNEVTVDVADLTGRRTRRKIEWRADWRPPQIVIKTAKRKPGGWVLDGWCVDDQGLAVVTVDGKETMRSTPGAYPTRIPINVEVTGAGKDIRIAATDAASNAIELVVGEKDLQAARTPAPARSRGWMMPAVIGPLRWITVAAVAGEPRTTAKDKVRPRLRLAGIRDRMMTSADEFYLDGDARDAGGLASISVNGEEWLKPEERGALHKRFMDFLPIDGTNRFAVVVRDMAGNETKQEFSVVQSRPAHMEAEYRLRVAVPPMLETSDVTWLKDPDIVGHYLRQEIGRPPARFRLLARGSESWAGICRELRLSAAELVDPAAALRIGKLLPAEKLFMGRSFADGKSGMSVFVHVVDTETGSAFTEDVYTEQDLADLRHKVTGLASKIGRRAV